MSTDPENAPESLPAPHEHVIFTDLGGGEGVLVDLNTKQYFHLNETASLIWAELANGRSVAAIARRLTDAYDIAQDEAETSVKQAIRHFAIHQLLTYSR